jgi:hypothetical protein
VREHVTKARFTELPALGDVFGAVGERYFVYRRYEASSPVTVVDTQTGDVSTRPFPAGCVQSDVMLAAGDQMWLQCDGRSAVLDVGTWTIVPGVEELTGPGTPVVGTFRYCAPFAHRRRSEALQQVDGRLVYSGARHHVFVASCGDARPPVDGSGTAAAGDRSLLDGWTTWVTVGSTAKRRCRVGAFDAGSRIRTIWRQLPFGPTRCTQRTFHTKYAVIAGHVARRTSGPNFLSSYRFAIARRP